MICEFMGSDTLFVSQTKVIKHYSGQCLTRPTELNKVVIMQECDGSVGQQWLLEKVGDISKEFVENYLGDNKIDD